MPKVKQDKAKSGRHSPSHRPEIQIPLALVTEPAASGARQDVGGKSGAAKSPRASAAAAPAVKALAGKALAERKPAVRLVSASAPAARPATGGDRKPRKPARAVRAEPGRASVASAKPSRKGAVKKPTRTTRAAVKPSSKSRPVKPLRKGSPKGAAKKGGPKVGKHLEQRKPERVVLVKELDPFARCGPRTSVEHLIRVEERLDGESSVHLVFFDRHGWYCEHGKACRAVDDVRRHGKQLGLTF